MFVAIRFVYVFLDKVRGSATNFVLKMERYREMRKIEFEKFVKISNFFRFLDFLTEICVSKTLLTFVRNLIAFRTINRA